MRSTRPLSYELVPLSPPTDLRTSAALKCASCGVIQKIPIMAWGNNPEKIIQAYIRFGWTADQHRAKDCLCPKCVKLKATKSAIKPAATEGENPMGFPREKFFTREKFVETLSGKPSMLSKTTHISSVRDMTPDQKTALRLRLEKSFDDSTGRYLDNQSDHLISEEMRIPRVVVIEYRELMFGPLKEDPEIGELRSVISDLKSGLADIQSRLFKAELRLNEVSKRNGL